jgi:porin
VRRLALCLAILLVSAGRPRADDQAEIPTMAPPIPGRSRPSKLTSEMRSLDDLAKSWFDWENVTGDWGGARPWLVEHGVFPAIVYSVEPFTNLHGGVERREPRALGNLDLTLTVDSGRLGAWKGGTLFVYGESLVGQGLGIQEDAGNPVDVVTTLEAEPFSRLAEYYVAQRLLGDRLALKVGKQDANTDFAASFVTAAFLNAGISPPSNIPMPTFPTPSPGLALRVRPTEWLSLAGGTYGGKPQPENFDDGGFADGDLFSIGEAALSLAPGRLPGNYRGGAWLLEADVPEFPSSATPRLADRGWGLYALVDQLLWPESAADDGTPDRQGASGFVEVSWAPPDRSRVELSASAGVVYRGPIPGRDDDHAGTAVVFAVPTPRLSGRTRETVVEWFYEAELTPWFAVQPDAQWIVAPRGRGADAFVLGLRAVVEF